MPSLHYQELNQQLDSGNLDEKEITKAKQGQKRDFPNGIPECGADALRMTLCSYNFKSEFTNMNVDHVRSGRNFCNKLWQLFRFYDRYLPREYHHKEFTPERPSDRWILSRLADVIASCDVNMRRHDLHLAAQDLQNFMHHQLCDVYLECIKPDLESGDEAVLLSVHHTLHTCLHAGLKLLHPFMPYITEELYQRLRSHDDLSESISIAAYPQSTTSLARDVKLEESMAIIRSIASRILNLKTVYNLHKIGLNVAIECHVTDSEGPLADLCRDLVTLSRSENVSFVREPVIGWLAERGDDVMVYLDPTNLPLDKMLKDVVSHVDRRASKLEVLNQNKTKSDDSTLHKKIDKLSSEVELWIERRNELRRLLASS